MGNTGVRDAADGIDFRIIFLRHQGAVAVTDRFGIFAFVGGGGIAEIDPEERADLHFIAGFLLLENAVFRQQNDLAGSQFPDHIVVEIGQGGGFHGDSISIMFVSEDNGGSAEFIACGIDGATGHQQDGAGAIDPFLCVCKPFLERRFCIDEGGDHFRGVVIAGAEFGVVGVMVTDGFFCKLVDVVDLADSDDGVHAESGCDHKGLIFQVTDDTDPAVAVQLHQIVVKLGAELGVCDVVNTASDGAALVHNRHTAPLCTEMRMVVCTVKKIRHAVIP